MSFFDDVKNVKSYIDMANGFDGRELIEILRRYVTEGSTVLELGMGPGKDLDILKHYYTVTGSDNSKVFLERYRSIHKDADLLLLDATALDTDRRFDCVYSNKVLMHLTREQLKQSLIMQQHILNRSGILFHSFWEGKRTEKMHDLLFVYYEKDELTALFDEYYDVLEIDSYTEFEKNDSLYVVARKTQ
jgi:cyclopropane fatty-acyl-phospholipid synthase-like methyltransferase